LHIATIHDRVPQVTQVTNRRHPSRQLTPQPIGDNRVQLIIAKPGDAIQGAHLGVRNKMNMGVNEPRENSRGGVLGHLPGLVELNVAGFDADDLFLIEKYGRWSFAELFPREHPRTSDGHHQHVILREPSSVKAGSELMRDMTKPARWSSSPSAASWKMVTLTYLIFSRCPAESRHRLHVWSETAAGASTVSLARPSRPLVAMITVAAGSRIAALKIKNLTMLEAGTNVALETFAALATLAA
jgi:hypothetical protein